MAADSSSFFARNLVSLLELFVPRKEGEDTKFIVDLDDDIIAAALLVHQGQLRAKRS